MNLPTKFLPGGKVATSSLLDYYQAGKKKRCKIGDILSILNSAKEEVAKVRITRVEIIKFRDITEEFAVEEGDGNLENWQTIHLPYYTQLLSEIGKDINPDTLLVCEWFKVIEESINLSCRPVESKDFETICNLPQNAEELFFMFPKAQFPFTVDQLKEAVRNRYNSTVVLANEEVVGFANFYEVEQNRYCSIGNVVVCSQYRNQGIGRFLIETMEDIAAKQYNVSELHLSCFNTNTKGILLYSKLGYIPYKIEQWTDKANNKVALLELKKNIENYKPQNTNHD